MAILDRIMQMQASGMTDPQIAVTLQQEGIPSSQINDSLNQARIKGAVSPNDPSELDDNNQQAPKAPSPEVYPQENQSAAPQAPSPEVYPTQSQNYSNQPQSQTPPAADAYSQYVTGEQQPQQDYYQQTPQAYSDQEYYQGGGSANMENVSEIAQQVVTEKLNEYKQKVGDVASFKNMATDKINDIDDRLKRIESTIDKLQQAIIGKIGEFGESTAMIHKDLENLHGTVGKLMNPLVDTYNELKKK